MAIISDERWWIARALFEAGKSLSYIVAETEIAKSTISERAKKEGWEKGINEQLILDEVEVELEKTNLNELQLKIHEKEVTRLTSNNMMIKTLSRANMEKLNEKFLNNEEMTVLDHKIAAEAICKAAIALGVIQK